MKLHGIGLLLILLVVPRLAPAQKNKPAQKNQKVLKESCTPETPPVIDGDIRDWQVEWLLDPKGKFIYNICNDAANLYVRLKVTDDMTQRKIGLFGLTVFLNANGKKIGKMGLKYPVDKTMEEIKSQTPTGGTLDARQLADVKRKLIEDQEVLQFVGFSKEPVVSSRLGLMNGIQVIIKADSIGDYIYEAKIPFKSFHIDKSSLKTLDVAFVTGKLIRPKVPKRDRNKPALDMATATMDADITRVTEEAERVTDRGMAECTASQTTGLNNPTRHFLSRLFFL